MVEVFGVPLDADVTADGLVELEGYRDDQGVWHFETRTPLPPGQPHIYEVKALSPLTGIEDVRTFRLIPGRIVTLDFLEL